MSKKNIKLKNIKIRKDLHTQLKSESAKKEITVRTLVESILESNFNPLINYKEFEVIGKLSKDNINLGFEAIEEIKECIRPIKEDLKKVLKDVPIYHKILELEQHKWDILYNQLLFKFIIEGPKKMSELDINSFRGLLIMQVLTEPDEKKD